MDLFKELHSTRTQELTDLLTSINDAVSKLEEEDHTNYLLLSRVSGKIEEILINREVESLLSSLTLFTFCKRVDEIKDNQTT